MGVNDDRDFCECCGKQNLQKVVWIEDTETGEIKHFGVICAIRPAKGFDLTSEIKKAARNHQSRMERIWSAAHKEYRSKGGKYSPMDKDYSCKVLSQDLWEECVLIVKKRVAEMEQKIKEEKAGCNT